MLLAVTLSFYFSHCINSVLSVELLNYVQVLLLQLLLILMLLLDCTNIIPTGYRN